MPLGAPAHRRCSLCRDHDCLPAKRLVQCVEMLVLCTGAAVAQVLDNFATLELDKKFLTLARGSLYILTG